MWSWIWGPFTLKGGTEEEKATDEGGTEQLGFGGHVYSAKEKDF